MPSLISHECEWNNRITIGNNRKLKTVIADEIMEILTYFFLQIFIFFFIYPIQTKNHMVILECSSPLNWKVDMKNREINYEKIVPSSGRRKLNTHNLFISRKDITSICLKGNCAPGLPYDFLFESDREKKKMNIWKKSR